MHCAYPGSMLGVSSPPKLWRDQIQPVPALNAPLDSNLHYYRHEALGCTISDPKDNFIDHQPINNAIRRDKTSVVIHTDLQAN